MMKPQVLTRAEFNENIAQLDGTQPIGFDVETNAKPAWSHDSRIVGFSIAGTNRLTGQTEGFMVPLAHRNSTRNADPDVLQAATPFLNNSRIIPFYVQMEATWLLAKLQLTPTFVGDAYILGRMLQMKEAGLKDMTEKMLLRKTIRMEDFLGKEIDFSMADPSAQIVIDYQIADAVNGLDLEKMLRTKINQQGMDAVYELELQTAVRLSYESYYGYQVDLTRLDQELKKEEEATAQLQREIFGMLGGQPFTINSPAQLGKALRGRGLGSPLRTDKGAESWSVDALEMLIVQCTQHGDMATVAVLKKICEWKSRFSTANSMRKRPADVSNDGRMHPTWRPIGFDGTSRIYSEGPSLTSLVKPARKALPAPAGKRWVMFDWAQAEVRILADLSGDEALKAIFKSGQDYHKAVYSGMSGKPYEDVTSEEREFSKVITYSILYSGGNAWHVARELGCSEQEAAEKVRKYFLQFPKLQACLDGRRAHAQQTRHVRTYMNRLRRLEGNDLQKIGDQACNSLGQQSCGTLLKIAINKMFSLAELGHPYLRGLSQVIPVFDSCHYCIDARIPIDEHIKFMKDQVELMVGDVKLDAEFKVSPASWGELTDFRPQDEPSHMPVV